MRALIFALWMFTLVISAEDKTEYILYTRENSTCEKIKIALTELNIKTFEGIPNANDGVTVFPTIVITVNGVEQKRVVGYTTKEALQAGLLIDHCVPAPMPTFYVAPVTCKTG